MHSERTPAASIERFFRFSMLGLLASGYLALAGSGYFDRRTLILTSALLLILATVKLLTARSNREYVYLGVISFIELIVAAILSAQASFFACLALYLVFAVAAFTSDEIRRGLNPQKHAIASLRRRFGWPLAFLAAGSTCAILFITAMLFLVVPRTARMAAILFPNAHRLTGFSNSFDLGGFGRISRDNRPVMHVLPYGRALPPGIKWRGAALSLFDGRRWSEPPRLGRPIATVNGYAEVADELQRSRRDGERLIYRVDLENSGAGTLFIAGVPEFINIDAKNLIATSGDAFRVFGPMNESLRYEVSAHSGPPLPSELTRAERARNLALPPIDIRIYSLARSWSGNDDSVDPLTRAVRIQDHLHTDFKYTLDGPRQPVRDPLADFLFVRKEGYCEYFASAMTVMLRTLGIPARVATGFQSGYFNDVSGLYVVRASDAHAWVEAWFDGLGWTTFDPTPPAAQVTNSLIFPRLDMYLDAADHTWREWVLSYDLGHQIAIAANFKSFLSSLGRASVPPGTSRKAWIVALAKQWGIGMLAAISIAVLLLFVAPPLFENWRRKARLRRIAQSGASPADATELYAHMLEILAQRGFEKPSWFTPAEFAKHLPPEESGRVSAFTSVYNGIRFGGDLSAAATLAAMLREFEEPGPRLVN